MCPCSPGAERGRLCPLQHLPAAVRDCGGIPLNLQDAVLNASHWSTFAWHRDWRSPSAYRGSGDGQTLIYRWDEAGMTLSDWRAVTEPLGRHRTFSAPQGSAIMSKLECVCPCVFLCACSCFLLLEWLCADVFVSVGGQLSTDYLVHLDDSDSGWASFDGRMSCKAGGKTACQEAAWSLSCTHCINTRPFLSLPMFLLSLCLLSVFHSPLFLSLSPPCSLSLLLFLFLSLPSLPPSLPWLKHSLSAQITVACCLTLYSGPAWQAKSEGFFFFYPCTSSFIYFFLQYFSQFQQAWAIRCTVFSNVQWLHIFNKS